MNEKTYEYDVVISFAGENRNIVEPLANMLKSSNISVFYDKFEEANLWGKNLYTYLSEVYNKKGKFCVIFVSKEYKQKVWTNKEREAAQARALKETIEYILPIRIDDTELPGMEETISYLDIRHPEMTSEKIVNLVLQKLGKSLIDTSFDENDIKNFELKNNLALFSGPPECWQYTAYLSYSEDLKDSPLIEKIKREMRPHYNVVDRYYQLQFGESIFKKAIPNIAASSRFLYLIGSNSTNTECRLTGHFSQKIELKIAFYLKKLRAIDSIIPIILPECEDTTVPKQLSNHSIFNLKTHIEKYGEKAFRIPIS